jgi:glycosyltransferase involved in cell wall biosynthesis
MSTVSIIIPTHSRPQLLPRAVASAQAAGKDVEVIVVDDGSQDETATVCQGLRGIKYVRLKRNQGVAAARNVGIFNSSSEYIAFLDDDDLRLPGSLDFQREMLAANPEAGFICGGMVMADQDYQETGEISLPRQTGDVFWDILELDFPIMPLSVMVRRDCFLRVGLFNHHLQGVDDWDMFVRLSELYPVLVTSQPVAVYRKPTFFSGQGSSSQAKQLLRAVVHQRELFQLPRVRQASASKRRQTRRRTINRVADALLWNAVERFPRGEYRFAIENVGTALRLNPLRAARPSAYKKALLRIFAN